MTNVTTHPLFADGSNPIKFTDYGEDECGNLKELLILEGNRIPTIELVCTVNNHCGTYVVDYECEIMVNGESLAYEVHKEPEAWAAGWIFRTLLQPPTNPDKVALFKEINKVIH